jgi:hypothetical protein
LQNVTFRDRAKVNKINNYWLRTSADADGEMPFVQVSISNQRPSDALIIKECSSKYKASATGEYTPGIKVERFLRGIMQLKRARRPAIYCQNLVEANRRNEIVTLQPTALRQP